jgi:hypothetical protein
MRAIAVASWSDGSPGRAQVLERRNGTVGVGQFGEQAFELGIDGFDGAGEPVRGGGIVPGQQERARGRQPGGDEQVLAPGLEVLPGPVGGR